MEPWRRDVSGNCYTWAFWTSLRYRGVMRWRRSDYGPWWHAAVTFDGGRTYWALVPRDWSHRDWLRIHRRPPLWFRGRVVRDFRRNEGMNA